LLGPLQTSLPFRVVAPGETRFHPLSNYLRANGNCVSRTAGHLLHLNVGQRLHQSRYRASRDIAGASHAELCVLVRTHHKKLFAVCDNRTVLSSARDHQYPMLEAKSFRRIIPSKVAILEAKLSIRVVSPDEELLAVVRSYHSLRIIELHVGHLLLLLLVLHLQELVDFGVRLVHRDERRISRQITASRRRRQSLLHLCVKR